MKALFRLDLIGIISLSELEACEGQLLPIIGINKVAFPLERSVSLIEMWVQGHANLRPTWRHFFWALREIKLNHLADQMEAYFSIKQETSSTLDVNLGSEETERSDLKQQEQGEDKWYISKLKLVMVI